MFAIASIGHKLFTKLQKRAYRHAYVAEHVRRGIAYQIRALRDQRGWNQGKLAEVLGKPQSVVSRLEDPAYGKVSLQTLLEIANAYDVALEVRYVAYSSFLKRTRDVSSVSLQVLEFKDDFMSLESLVIESVSANQNNLSIKSQLTSAVGEFFSLPEAPKSNLLVSNVYV